MFAATRRRIKYLGPLRYIPYYYTQNGGLTTFTALDIRNAVSLSRTIFEPGSSPDWLRTKRQVRSSSQHAVTRSRKKRPASRSFTSAIRETRDGQFFFACVVRFE